MQAPTVQQTDGRKMPAIGLGTANSHQLNEEGFQKFVDEAISVGYRHFDTAWIYNNQVQMGKALNKVFQQGTVARDDLYITSKIWNTHHSTVQALKNCQTTLRELQLEFVDLLLTHSPMGWKDGDDPFPVDANGNPIYSDVDYLETWIAMEKCVENGWTKSIGVSNFNIAQLKRLLENCTIKPVTNQVEMHPYLQQQELLDFCKENKIIITAYSPIAAPYERWSVGIDQKSRKSYSLLTDPVIEQIAKTHGKSSAQICLKWAVDRGTVPIPKTVTKSRMIENIDIFSLKLSDEETKKINGLEVNWRAYPLDKFQDHVHCPF